MTILNEAQTDLAVKALHEFLSSPVNPSSGKTLVEEEVILDKNRYELIEKQLAPAVQAFLTGSMPLAEFKTEIDSINKQNTLWGFSGIKGQMFFNLLFNACTDEAELTAELTAAIATPDSEDMAKSRMRNFTSYVRRIGDAYVEGGGKKHARPKLSSIPFFLSYFWQIQSPQLWPVYFTNSVQVLTDLNLYQQNEDLAEAYIEYTRLHTVLQSVFSAETSRTFTLYDVEHVWWYVGQVKKVATVVATVIGKSHSAPTRIVDAEESLSQLPDSYVPPIISVIPRLAANDSQLEAAAKASGTSVSRALEKSINAAFTILGYETLLLGQGQGRIQDGLAIAPDHSYAILWDAKARQKGYSMGTDDRTVREYITTQSRELKKKRHLRNLYYIIISSSFQNDFDDLISGLKMDTDINEVCLVESDAFVAMVDAKLRDPNQLSLGPDGLQRLFCKSGILNSNTVRDEFG
jgi:hypothetical protein